MVEWFAGWTGWKVVKAIPGVAKWIDSYRDRRHRRAIVNDLNTLAFWQEGMLDQIHAIAEGRGEPRHILEIRSHLGDTDAVVEAAGQRLLQARNNYVSFEIGAQVARAVGDIVHKKVKDTGIRYWIRNLVTMDPSHRAAQEAAQTLIADIDNFNTAHTKLVDDIRRRKPTRVRRTAKLH